MQKGLQPLSNGTCLADWMALITLSAMANALSVTCAISWHIYIERPETNYQLWLPDKAPIPTYFPCQTERGGGCSSLSNSERTLHKSASPFNSNCPAHCCLLMWEKCTAAQRSWGKLNLKRREPYGWGWFIYKLADEGHRGPTLGFRGNGL